MILKLRMSGEKYRALLDALQSDTNHYWAKNCGKDRRLHPKVRRPFVRERNLKSDNDDGRSLLLERDVALEVKEEAWLLFKGDDDVINTPLSALTNIFDAIGLFPALVTSADEEA